MGLQVTARVRTAQRLQSQPRLHSTCRDFSFPLDAFALFCLSTSVCSKGKLSIKDVNGGAEGVPGRQRAALGSIISTETKNEIKTMKQHRHWWRGRSKSNTTGRAPVPAGSGEIQSHRLGEELMISRCAQDLLLSHSETSRKSRRGGNHIPKLRDPEDREGLATTLRPKGEKEKRGLQHHAPPRAQGLGPLSPPLLDPSMTPISPPSPAAGLTL